MTIASLIYNAASVLCMAAVAGWLLVRLCNAWTRPDDHAQDINRAKLADAMLPMRFAEATAEGRE